jgi:predicted RNase H-like HicB family nuclease
MLQQYIQAAMNTAVYQILPDSNSIYGELPVCKGVYAKAQTFESCRNELMEVLEEWLIIRLRHNLEIPKIGQIDLCVTEFEDATY